MKKCSCLERMGPIEIAVPCKWIVNQEPTCSLEHVPEKLPKAFPKNKPKKSPKKPKMPKRGKFMKRRFKPKMKNRPKKPIAKLRMANDFVEWVSLVYLCVTLCHQHK